MRRYILIKRLLLLVFLGVIAAESFGCAANSKDVTMDNVEEFKMQLHRDLPAGSPVAKVVDCFKSLGFEHTYVVSDKTVYAIVPKIGRFRIIYTTSLLIRVRLDESELVKNIEFELEHTGL